MSYFVQKENMHHIFPKIHLGFMNPPLIQYDPEKKYTVSLGEYLCESRAELLLQ
jgi:hypothetical protein